MAPGSYIGVSQGSLKALNMVLSELDGMVPEQALEVSK